jgi:hypothetical protein
MNTGTQTYRENFLSHTSESKPDKMSLEFLVWMDEVEKKIFEKTQMMLLDLPDENYIVHFEKKMSADDMVKLILSNNYGFV